MIRIIVAKDIFSAGGYVDLNNDKSYLFIDGHNYPKYMVWNNGDGTYLCVEFDKRKLKDDMSWQLISHYTNDIIVGIRKDGLNNFLLAYNHIFKSRKTYDLAGLATLLLKNMGFNLNTFENKLFETVSFSNSDSGVAEIKYKKWRIVFPEKANKDNKLFNMFDTVERLCGKFASLLCYGVVEVKSRIGGKTGADYEFNSDSLRITTIDMDKNFVRFFLHELAHRLLHLFLSGEQKDLIREKYFELRTGKKLVDVEIGDEIVLQGGMGGLVYKLNGGNVHLEVTQTPPRKRRTSVGDKIYYKGLTTEDLVSVNGKKIKMEDMKFPSAYARVNEGEFFCECFSYWRLGELSRDLADWMEGLL